MEKLTINKEFAKKYEEKKRREELSKLRDKYGNDFELESESSSSEEEDEYAEALTADKERDFLRTLALVKSKDPKIYDPSLCFFKEDEEEEEESDAEEAGGAKPKEAKRNVEQVKSKPVYLRDYEMQLLKEHGSQAFALDSDESDAEREKAAKRNGKSYVEEQEDIKREIKLAAGESDESDGDDDDFLTLRSKNKTETKLEADYKLWLKGEGADMEKQAKKDLAPLKRFWNDPKLAEDERFLRDYILNEGYIDKEADELPTYEELVDEDEDEEAVEDQEQFERKYNFRFEEPDAEFIKSYPRTTSSVRKVNDSRRVKRKAREERKQKEKEEREAELKRLKKLKRREIQEKVAKVQDITGVGVDLDKIDLDGDFDPKKYDQAMQAAFGSDYYDVDEMEKPAFSDLDDGSEGENEEVASGAYGDYSVAGQEEDVNEESYAVAGGDGSEEFNMDADYDPSTAAVSKKQLKRDRRRRKRGQPAPGELPVYNPDEKTIAEYLEEYFKLDYEDTIAGDPCRFKYREVMPNTFGLSTEEVLTCQDRELNSWASLKKSIQYRTEEEEDHDLRKYRKRKREGKRKRRILASAYKEDSDEQDENGTSQKQAAANKPFKVPSTKRKRHVPAADNPPDAGATEDSVLDDSTPDAGVNKKKKKMHKGGPSAGAVVSDGRKALFGIDPNRSKHQKRKQKANAKKASGT